MTSEITSLAALWWAVIFSGVYHGINPGMGWPLAISAALMQNKNGAFLKALVMLAVGHFLAMIAILLPFSVMLVLVNWEVEIRITAGFLVIVVGVYLMINPRHPKFLVRVHPTRLALWSFLAATAHGANALIGNNFLTSFTVAAVHTFAMTFAGGLIATVIYLWLGLKFISTTWLNLDRVWAFSLILVGIIGVTTVYNGH